MEIIGGDVQSAKANALPKADVYEGDTRVAKARPILAFGLLILLALVILGHYIVISIFVWNSKTEVRLLETAFNTSLPVLSGAVGTAIAFYFKDRGK